MTYQEHFARYGFIHVKGALGPTETAELRAYLHDRFKARENQPGTQDNFTIYPREMLADKRLWGTLFLEPVVSALKEILEPNFTMIPDFLISKDLFLLSGGGWHWDASAEGKQPYHHDARYRVVKCGLYLQENTREFGGGVDITPGFHRWPLRTRNTNLNYKAKTLSDFVGKALFGKTVKLMPGDFLAFDSCIPHRTTTPRTLFDNASEADHAAKRLLSVPEDKSKFVIYWDACRSDWGAHFHGHTLRRAHELELSDPGCRKFFHAESSSILFPDDYPDEFVAAVNRAGMQIESHSVEEANSVKRQMDARLAHHAEAPAQEMRTTE